MLVYFIFVKMYRFCVFLIAFFSLTTSNAIYLSNNFSLKNYTLAKTKVYSSAKDEYKNKCFFVANISNKSIKIFLKYKNIPHLYNSVSEILILNGNKTTSKKISNNSWNIVEGFVADNSRNSGVSGYIQGGEFYGTINLDDKLYYVENINRYTTLLKSDCDRGEFNAIIYDEDAIQGGSHKSSFNRKVRHSHPKDAFDEAKIIYKQFIKDRHICPLLVLLDNSFLSKIHKNDALAAVGQIMLSINEVNAVFRSTDFDGDGVPDNIGFLIKYLVLIENEDSPFNYLPRYSDKPISSRSYLAYFAQYLILREVCLGVAFTGQSFQENVLGVSYSAVSENDISIEMIGGICQRPFTKYMLSLNVAAVSYVSTKGFHLPQGTLDACLSHEFGHAFGCRHDRQSDPGYNPEYIMSSHTLPGTSTENFQFSPTSKKHLVITVPKKGYCMLKVTEPFCGNGLLEQGEECDCGARYSCLFFDPCCIPSGIHGACQINRALGYQCHPSQGYCCNSHCKYENLERIDVDCQRLSQTCPCENENCTCGIAGRCLGSECQSEECVRIDAKECDCPHLPKQDSCNICCLSNTGGPCLSSKELTRMKLELGLITLNQLSKFHSMKTLTYNTEVENICHGLKCISLDFKKFRIGDYCLKNGKLGKCGTFGCGFRSNNVVKMGRSYRNIGIKRSDTLGSFRISLISYYVIYVLLKDFIFWLLNFYLYKLMETCYILAEEISKQSNHSIERE